MIIAPPDKTIPKTQGEAYQPSDEFSPPPTSEGTFSPFPEKSVRVQRNPIIFTMSSPMEMNSGAYSIDFSGAWCGKIDSAGL